MPELSECRLMADFVNSIAKDVIFETLKKSDVSKVKTDLSLMKISEFHVIAESRGKEILLRFIDRKTLEEHDQVLLLTMGMSGNFIVTKVPMGVDANGDYYELPVHKHAHLKLYGYNEKDGYTYCLQMVDVRRFAKWSWAKDFSSNRGADPVRDHEQFRIDLYEKVRTGAITSQPALDVMMNQSVFNGIGNYLRAEILDRAGINPFKPLSRDDRDIIADLCKRVPEESYVLGGGQLKDWKNADGTDPKSFIEWMQCYQKKCWILDASNRKFWFDEKWKETEEYKKYAEDSAKLKAKRDARNSKQVPGDDVVILPV